MSSKKADYNNRLIFEDFLRFTIAKGLPNSCPGCGDAEARWTVNGLPEGRYPTPTPMPALVYGRLSSPGVIDSIYSTGMPLITSVCNYCGYTKLFSAEKVIEWKEAEEAAKAMSKATAELNTEEGDGSQP